MLKNWLRLRHFVPYYRFQIRTSYSVAVIHAALLVGFCIALSGASPIDPDEGRPHVRWQDAEQVVGRTAFVYGKIVKVGHASAVHFLNFDPQRRDVFKLVVFEGSLERFAGTLEELYQDKLVRVQGMVSRYGGVPQIVVASPSQIQLLDALPELEAPPRKTKRVPGAELTIATWNAGNLFDDIDAPETSDEGTPAKPRDQLEALGATIRLLDADIVALQEVENREYLGRFVEVFLPDQGYDHIVHYEGNDLRGIDVCLLSRVPVGAVTSYRHQFCPDQDGKRRRFSRDLLRVALAPDDAPPFEVWVLHLKSNADGREQAAPVRLAEAREVRRLIDERLTAAPDAAIVVCGDFNDTPESESTQTVIGKGGNQLHSDWEQLPPERRVSFNRDPYRSLIDFVLWSPAMQMRYVPGSYRIFDDQQAATASDHFPAVARFRWK